MNGICGINRIAPFQGLNRERRTIFVGRCPTLLIIGRCPNETSNFCPLVHKITVNN